MGTKVIEYVDASQLYATNYIRNSKAIAVLWAIFTICYSIIVVVSFVTPGEHREMVSIGHTCCKQLSITVIDPYMVFYCAFRRMGWRLRFRDWRSHWPMESLRAE